MMQIHTSKHVGVLTIYKILFVYIYSVHLLVWIINHISYLFTYLLHGAESVLRS